MPSRVHRLLTASTFALSSTLALAQTQSFATPASSAPARVQTVHYGVDPLQFAQLRLPASREHIPVVIVVHGGCWADHFPGPPGAHPLPDASLTAPLAAALTRAGLATWNIEYRRQGSPGGGWPNTYLDLAAAVDYLRQIAPDNHLDLSHVVVVGHSSGGQLALWLGARSRLPKTSQLYTSDPLVLHKIIDIDGPPDLTAAQPLESQYCPMPAVTQFMQGTPADHPERYHDGSAQAFLPLRIPQIIIKAGLLQNTGTLAADYQTAAVSKGDSITIIPLESNHFEMLNPTSKPGKSVIALILKEVRGEQK